MRPNWQRLILGSAVVLVWPAWTAAGQPPVSPQEPQPVRGAHETVKKPEKTVTDELGLTVPGVPIDHPGRVYPASDDFPTGPAIGERLPEFVLPNQDGTPVDFDKDRAGRKAVVVFFRSVVW